MKTAVPVLVFLGLLFAQQSASQEIERPDPTVLALSLGYGYSDNPLRTDSSDITSGIWMAGILADWSLRRPNFTASLDADFDYLFYSDEQIKDRPEGDIDADLSVGVVKDVVNWWVRNRYSQLRDNIFLADTPDNLNEFNVLSSGVSAQVPFGDRTFGQLQAAYSSRTYAGGPDLDSVEVVYGAGIARRLKSVSRIELNFLVSEIEYDDIFETRYDIQRAFGSYTSQLASGEAHLSVGANQVSYEEPLEDLDWSPLFRLTWQRQVFRRSTFAIDASQMYTELGGSVSLDDVSGNPRRRSSGTITTSRPSEETRLSARYSTQFERSSIGAGVVWFAQEFDSLFIPDSESFGIDLDASRELGARTYASLRLSFYRRSFDAASADRYDDKFAFLALDHRLAKSISLRVGYEYRGRSAPNDSGYRENFYRLDFLIGRLRD